MPDKNNLEIFLFSQNFSNFFGGGVGGGPSALRGASAPLERKTKFS
jgi:hypothetical protein